MTTHIDAQKFSKAFKALSNPNRLQIYLEIVHHREARVETDYCGCMLSEIMSVLSIGAPTVSHHLKELVNADLIHVERQGKFVNCHVNEELRESLREFFTAGFCVGDHDSDEAGLLQPVK